MTDIDAKAREIALSRHTTDDAYADAIAAALLSVRYETLEEAAKVAQEQHVYGNTFIATAIRALKEGGQRGGKA